MTLRERVAAGDRAALGEAFQSHRAFAAKMIRERHWSDGDLDDLVQEAFLLLPACAEHCRPEKSLAGCLATAVKQAIHRFRHSKATALTDVYGKTTRAAAAELDSLPSFDAPADEMLEQRERVHRLSEAVERLPPHHRLVVTRKLGFDSRGQRYAAPSTAAAWVNARRHLLSVA